MDFSWSIWLIPFIAALVGWGTNWLALKMTFYPLEFKGWWIFGWQGVIPSQAPKLAHNVMQLITEKLMDLEAIFSQLDPKQIAREMEPQLDELARNTVDQAMDKQMPIIWTMISQKKKEEIYANARRQFPGMIESLFAQLRKNIHQILDIEKMLKEELLRDKTLLNRVFLTCGAKELKFIERSGIYFGFLFGCIQMLIWNQFDHWWILPLGGLIVGFATNWLALKLIFRPLKPYKFGPFVLQGMFIKRQPEVSEVYSEIFAKEILTPGNIFDHVLKNQGADRLIAITQQHLKEGFDEIAGTADRIVLKLVAGTEKYASVRNMVVSEFIEVLPLSVKDMLERDLISIDIQSNLELNMKALTAVEFEGALHPIFQEEEWLLILIGAMLGLGAGFLQLVFLV
ncbi:MAG: hypothetical protein WD334_06520 [Chitinophagales bacterium]